MFMGFHCRFWTSYSDLLGCSQCWNLMPVPSPKWLSLPWFPAWKSFVVEFGVSSGILPSPKALKLLLSFFSTIIWRASLLPVSVIWLQLEGWFHHFTNKSRSFDDPPILRSNKMTIKPIYNEWQTGWQLQMLEEPCLVFV